MKSTAKKIKNWKLVRTRYGSTRRRLRLAFLVNEKKCLLFVGWKRSRREVVKLSCLRCLNIAREGDNVSRRKIVGGCLVDSPEMDHLAGCWAHNTDKYLLCKDREKKKPRIVCYSSHRLNKMLVYYQTSRTHGYLFREYKGNHGHEMALCIGCNRKNAKRPSLTREIPVRGAVSGNTLFFDPRRGHVTGCEPVPIDQIKATVLPKRRIKQKIMSSKYITPKVADLQSQHLNETDNEDSASLEHCDLDMDALEATIDYKREAVGTHYGPIADDTNISNDRNDVSPNNFDAAEARLPLQHVLSGGLNETLATNCDGLAESNGKENAATNVGPTGDEKRSDTPALASHDDTNEFIVDPEVSHHTLSFAQEQLEDGILTAENGARNDASFGITEGLVSGSKRHGFQASDDEWSFDGEFALETMDVDRTPPRTFGPANYDPWHDARPKVQPRSKRPEVITISDDENNGSLIDKEGTIILSSDDEDMEIAFSLIRQQEAMLKAFETKHVTTYAATKEALEVERKLLENKPGQAELPTDESMVMDLSEPGVAISAPQTEVADGDTEESQCTVERIIFVSAEAEKEYFVEEQVLAMGAVGHNKTMDIDSAVNRAALKEIEYQAVNGERGVRTPPVIENNCAHPKFVDAELNNEQEPMTNLAEIACGYVADEETETGQVLEKRSGEVDQAERSHEVVFVATSPVNRSVHRMMTRSKDSCKRKATNYRNLQKYGCEQPVAKITVLHDSVDVSDADDKPLSHLIICHKTMRMRDNTEPASNAKNGCRKPDKRICQEKSAKYGGDEESSNGSQSPSDDTDDEEFTPHVSIQQHFRKANIRAHKAAEKAKIRTSLERNRIKRVNRLNRRHQRSEGIPDVVDQSAAVDPSTISLFEDRPITERREVFVMPRYSPKLLKKSTWVHPDNRQLIVQEIQEGAAPPLVGLVDILKPLVDAMNPAVMEREFAVFDNLPMPELGENDSLSDLDLFSLDDEERAWFENLVNNTDLEHQYVVDGEENDLFGLYHQ